MKIYSNESETLWIDKLLSAFYYINAEVYDRFNHYLPTPTFSLCEMSSYGVYCPNKTKYPHGHIKINLKLIKNFEWNAVEQVLRHEMAHMVVDKILRHNHFGCSHGEMFKIAAEALKVSANPHISVEDLKAYKGILDNPMADKVRKLLNKGYACDKAEAELFIAKANELMLRHNISTRDICGQDKLFLKRPLGYKNHRMPNWTWCLVNILKNYYEVEVILCSDHYEIFGEPHNLDIAEYVFDTLMQQAKMLYAQSLQEHKVKTKDDENYRAQHKMYSHVSGNMRQRRFSERSFMIGLFNEFSRKLGQEQEKTIKVIEVELKAIVPTSNRALLKEMYYAAYPSMKMSASQHSPVSSIGYGAGKSAACNLHLRSAVKESSNSGHLIA